MSVDNRTPRESNPPRSWRTSLRAWPRFSRVSLLILIASTAGCGSADPNAPTQDHFQAAIAQAFANDPRLSKLCTNATYPSVIVAREAKAVTAEASNYDAKAIAQEQALANVGILTEHRGSVNATLLHGFTSTKGQLPTLRFAFVVKGSEDKGVTQTLPPSADVMSGAPGDGSLNLCYATKTIDRVDNFTVPADAFGQHISEVTYFQKVTRLEPWAKDPSIQAAFPELRQDLDHLSTTPAKMDLTLTNKGWQAVGT